MTAETAGTGERHDPDLRAVAPWFTVVIGAAVAVSGLLLPWSTQPAFDVSRAGIEIRSGKVLFLVALATGVAAMSDRVRRSSISFAVMAVGAVCTFALTLAELAEVAGFGPGVEIGFGLWVTLAGAVIVVAGVLWRIVET